MELNFIQKIKSSLSKSHNFIMNAFVLSAALAAVLLAIAYAQEDCPSDFQERVAAAKQECKAAAASRERRQIGGGNMGGGGRAGGGQAGAQGGRGGGGMCVLQKMKGDAFIEEISDDCSGDDEKARRMCIIQTLKERCPDLFPNKGGRGGAGGAGGSPRGGGEGGAGGFPRGGGRGGLRGFGKLTELAQMQFF